MVGVCDVTTHLILNISEVFCMVYPLFNVSLRFLRHMYSLTVKLEIAGLDEDATFLYNLWK